MFAFLSLIKFLKYNWPPSTAYYKIKGTLVERVSYTLLFSFMPPPLLICFFPNFWAPGWGCRPTNENSEAPTLTSYSWANGKLTPQIQTCEERKSSLLNNDNYHYNNNNASLSWCTADLLYFPGFYVLQTCESFA